MAERFDAIVDVQARKRGIPGSEAVPWANITKYALLIYLVVTCFSCYYRADFMSLTTIALGIYSVELPHFFRRYVFRLLVAFIFITFVYDFIHLFFIHDSREDDEADGGLQSTVRTFSYFFAWISFLLRPIILVIFWKDSLDFMKIIRQQSTED